MAAATLQYDYPTSSVWIEHLHVESHPMHHDLCLQHADRLSVPQGWELHDTRTVDIGQARGGLTTRRAS